MQEAMCEYPFPIKDGLMSVGHVCLYHTFPRELVFEPQLDQKEIFAPGFLKCRAQSESKGPFSLNSSA